MANPKMIEPLTQSALKYGVERWDNIQAKYHKDEGVLRVTLTLVDGPEGKPPTSVFILMYNQHPITRERVGLATLNGYVNGKNLWESGEILLQSLIDRSNSKKGPDLGELTAPKSSPIQPS
jgi:hypothetical protein